jgi:hypothetical protein
MRGTERIYWLDRLLVIKRVLIELRLASHVSAKSLVVRWGHRRRVLGMGRRVGRPLEFRGLGQALLLLEVLEDVA